MNQDNNGNELQPDAKTTAFAAAQNLPSIKRNSTLLWMQQVWPTALVMLLLGAVAWAGHQSDWRVRNFLQLFEKHAESEEDDWCDKHSVPKSICVECNESLLPRIPSTWCKEHGIHNCPFERPEVAQLQETPVISKEDLERAKRALDLKERKKSKEDGKNHMRRIQIASEAVRKKMEIKSAQAKRAHEVLEGKPLLETLMGNGAIAFDQPRVAPAAINAAGRVALVTEKGQLGVRVKQGDVLALFDAADVGKAKAELLQAYATAQTRQQNFNRFAKAYDEGVLPAGKMMDVELQLREATIRLSAAQRALDNMGVPIRIDPSLQLANEDLAEKLRLFGIPPEIAATLKGGPATANLVPVRAARDGTVIAVNVGLGETVLPGKPLFVVADTSRMWLLVNIRITEAKYLRIRDPSTKTPGQTVLFETGGVEHDLVGELVWKSSDVDDKTHTAMLRAEVDNHDGRLLAHSFGMGRIVLRSEKDAIVVPNEAVHWDGDSYIVFVQDKNFDQDDLKVYHVREVRVGVVNGGYTEIIAGLLPGEWMATHNSLNLRSQLLKHRIGIETLW